MKDQFRSDLCVSKVTVPVLVVHGENDTIVPVTLGERLYGLISAPKCFVRIAGAGHNDVGAQAVAAANSSLPSNDLSIARAPGDRQRVEGPILEVSIASGGFALNCWWAEGL
jgi:fermentation-respiration switch protein FrsA (DUF1100 family)